MTYGDLVRALFSATPGAGRVSAPGPGGPAGDVYFGRGGGAACGAEVEFSLLVAGGRIVEARFLARGCPYTIAAASLVAGRLGGLPLAEAGCDPHALARELEAPPEKLGRLLLVEDALRDALARCTGRDAGGG